jgi:DNA-binding NarL/FixJ family response regulator
VPSRKLAAVPLQVLVADRDPDFGRELQFMLASVGDAEVVAVTCNGAATVALAAELIPDVVLLDLRLPPVGGVQVAAHLHDEHLPAAVVMLLDDASAAEVVRARQAGVRAFVRRSDARAVLPDLLSEVALLGVPTPPCR